MRKITIITVLAIFSFSINAHSQSSDIGFGLKTGANYSKFSADSDSDGSELDFYKRKVGFYLGGFLNVDLSNKFQFQPELLFALEGTSFEREVETTDSGFESNPTVSDFESDINDYSIAAPLVIRYLITETLFLEAGPQLAYVLDRKEKIKKSPFEQSGDPQPAEYDYDRFDLGLTLGAGYRISESLTLNGRYIHSLLERENNIKSSIFNLGIEYKLR
jgi:hypothetical protein